MPFQTTITQQGTFASTITQGEATFTLDQVSAPATFTASIAALGPAGQAATIEVGTVVTVGPDDPATVTNSGTTSAAVFDFEIPQGEQGEQGIQGIQGIQGNPGTAATIAAGTVTTLPAGDPATVTNAGTSSAAVFNFGIPQGVQGIQGIQGIQGVPGVVSASAPITYNSGTQTVGIDQTGFLLKADNLAGLGNTGTARTNLGLGTMATETAANYPTLAGGNSFSGTQVVSVNTSGTAFRITQEGAGEAFRVEDETNPDSTAFIVDSSGNVGIKASVTNASYPLLVAGNAWVQGLLNAQSGGTSGGVLVNHSGTGVGMWVKHENTGASSDAVRITNLGSGNSLVVEDSTNPDSTPFIINANGDVGIGTTSIGVKLAVSGRGQFNSTTGAGGDPVLAVLNSGGGNVASLLVQSTAATSSGANVAVFSNHASATADCVRITNLGSGNSFVVEDSTNPDSTPFVINNAGNVGIGVSAPSFALQVNGPFYASQSSHELAMSSTAGVAITAPTSATVAACTITNAGSGASLRVNDVASDTTPFIVDAGGNVGVKTASPSTDFEVNGNAKVTSLNIGTSGAVNSIVQNATDPGLTGLQTYNQEIHINLGGTVYKLPARV